MKKIIYTISVFLIGISCIHKSSKKIIPVNQQEIAFITIEKDGFAYFLSDKQQTLVIESMNNAEGKGLYKYFPLFKVRVQMLNETDRNFRFSSKLFKEKGDYSFEISDSLLLNKLWADTLGNNVKKFRILGNNLYKDKQGNIYLQTIDRTSDNKLEFCDFLRFDTIIGSDTTFYGPKIKHIIDLESFKRIEDVTDSNGTIYFEDKNNTYFLRPMAEGGKLHGRKKS